ncbi:hypothetical protein BDA99DRAFT_148558 [Phascolomyces articulosus]|uniref:Uncharacterized protein n=1 Tax=Phascolomyces articulosus TaxID=60185 RepID=A0AAD5PB77_9FUNG|nr:hypothetical protein BDA99DRAFT_148558 [Phascolomyces articulosus]
MVQLIFYQQAIFYNATISYSILILLLPYSILSWVFVAAVLTTIDQIYIYQTPRWLCYECLVAMFTMFTIRLVYFWSLHVLNHLLTYKTFLFFFLSCCMKHIFFKYTPKNGWPR